HFHAPDQIQARPALYGEYVRWLFDILSTQSGLSSQLRAQRIDMIEQFIAKVTQQPTAEAETAVIQWFTSQFPGVTPWRPALHPGDPLRQFLARPDAPAALRDVDLSRAMQRAHEWKPPP